MGNKPDYTWDSINRLLKGYTMLQTGKLPYEDKLDILSKPTISNGEAAAIYKLDIDKAISQLIYKEKFVIIVHTIMGYDFPECAYWMGLGSLDVAAIEDIALHNIMKILNTKK